MEYIHLVGVEQVQSAANRMMEAAHEMHRAANSIRESVIDLKLLLQSNDTGDRLDEIIKILARMEDNT